MSELMRDRLFDPWHAFDNRVTVWVAVAVAVYLIGFLVGVFALARAGRMEPEAYTAALNRWWSWLWLSLAVAVPMTLGPAWTMCAVAIFSLLCYGEYARATGLFREKVISAVVVLGILAVTFSVFDHYDRLFFATASLTSGLIALAGLLGDRPDGFVQRVALGLMGFLLFGFSLGYLGSFANHADYRPVMSLIFLGIILSDVSAAAAGRTLRGPPLLANICPNWTISGSAVSLAVTAPTVAAMGHFAFLDTAMDSVGNLLFLGILVGGLSQLGTFVLAAIKRDVGVTGMGGLLPGYGGLLDRFDSLVFVPPAVFHFLSMVLGPLGSELPQRILTGGGQWTIGN